MPSLLNYPVCSNRFPPVVFSRRELSTFFEAATCQQVNVFVHVSSLCQYVSVLYSSGQKHGTSGSYLSAGTTYAKRPVLFSVFVSVLDVQ